VALIVGSLIKRWYSILYKARAVVHPVYAYSPTGAHPPFSNLDMYAPCPHATSASVWVAVGRPRAGDLGGVVWWISKRSLYW
jgi:hypothetical protein